MLADSHCHINQGFYDTDFPGAVSRAEKAGIKFMVNAGTDIAYSKEALAISRENPRIAFSPGIHPHSAGEAGRADLSELSRLAKDPAAAALGETGLDFYYDSPSKEKQTALFLESIRMAKDNGLPIIIHSREASFEVLEILSSEYTGKEDKPNGVLHCFSGDTLFARECIQLNFYISFAGNLTYPGAGNLRRTAAEIPLDRILIETDSPFLAPQPVRGQKNEPSFLAHTAAELAGIKGVSKEETARATLENTVRVFPGITNGAARA